jgi:predicted ATPase
MITHITISNYRSFVVTAGSRAHEFDLSPLTIIVGDNSAGKSNILRAISFATTPYVTKVKRTDFSIRIAKDKPRKAGRIEITLTSEIGGVLHTITCLAEGTDEKGYSKSFIIDGTTYPGVTDIAPPTTELLAALAPHEVFVTPTVRDIEYLNTAKELLPLATRSTIAAASKSLRDKLSDKLSHICQQLQEPLGVKGVMVSPLLNIEDLMGIVRLGFEVDDAIQLPIQNIGQGHISKGILKLAQLQGAHRTICIEEPEIHVHPTGIKSILKTFSEVTRNGDRQILVTTHSPEVINCVEFENLLSVRKVKQRSVVKAIDPQRIGVKGVDPEKVEHNILRKDQRGDLFLSKYVLLVEGEYDRLILELIDRDGRIGFLNKDIRIVEMGSLGEFPKYHHLLKELGRPFAALLDDGAIFDRHTDAAGNKTIVEGVVLKTLANDNVLPLHGSTTPQAAKYANSTPQSKRSQVKASWNDTSGKDIVLIAHGHHDISDFVKECWDLVSDPDERLAAYKALGGKNPMPTNIDIDGKVMAAIKKKGFDMLRVVAALPVARFERLSRPLNAAFCELMRD